jgi:AraC-like DNA-binding protein
MKPKYLKVATDAINSFSCRRDKLPNINNYWHRHPELELIKIDKGHGKLFIGNKILNFKDGDMVLIGSNIPHYWKFDEAYFRNNQESPTELMAVHFNEKFWGDSFLNLPENRVLKEIIQRSGQGMLLRAASSPGVTGILDDLYHAVNTERILLLLRILLLFNNNEVLLLMPVSYLPESNSLSNERVAAIYEYLFKNFKNNIQLQDVAKIAGMTPNAFCRYFKSATGKTYSQLLIEIKVEYACKLLIENNLNIKYIGFESGFNNLASFYKNFKTIIGNSPLNYQKQFNVASNKSFAA